MVILSKAFCFFIFLGVHIGGSLTGDKTLHFHEPLKVHLSRTAPSFVALKDSRLRLKSKVYEQEKYHRHLEAGSNEIKTLPAENFEATKVSVVLEPTNLSGKEKTIKKKHSALVLSTEKIPVSHLVTYHGDEFSEDIKTHHKAHQRDEEYFLTKFQKRRWELASSRHDFNDWNKKTKNDERILSFKERLLQKTKEYEEHKKYEDKNKITFINGGVVSKGEASKKSLSKNQRHVVFSKKIKQKS